MYADTRENREQSKSVVTGQCDVDAVMVLLVQEMIYTCDPGEDSERQKKEVMVVSEIKDEADSNPGETKVTTNVPKHQGINLTVLYEGLRQSEAQDPP